MIYDYLYGDNKQYTNYTPVCVVKWLNRKRICGSAECTTLYLGAYFWCLLLSSKSKSTKCLSSHLYLLWLPLYSNRTVPTDFVLLNVFQFFSLCSFNSPSFLSHVNKSFHLFLHVNDVIHSPIFMPLTPKHLCIFGFYGVKCLKNYTCFTLPCRGLGLVGLALDLVDWSTIVLQCFDTVGWVIWPINIVPDMTYNVFGGTLNPTLLPKLCM